MKRFIVAIDQGTTSSKAILSSLSGKPVYSSQKEFNQYFPKDGWVEHNPNEIWSTTKKVLKDAINKSKKLKGKILTIGITNQRETTILWDKRTGKPIYNAIVWQDRRTAEFCKKFKTNNKEKIINKKIEKINSKKSLFFEPKLESFLKNALSTSLEISSDVQKVVKNCDLIFLTVGTPKSKSGFIDLSMIKNASKNIGISLRHSSKKPIIVVKSTVIPGTTTNVIQPLIEKASRKKTGKGFEIIANPEFLREGNVISDTLKPHLVVIGGSNSNSVNRLKKFYRKLYDSKIKFMITNTQTAEMIKYANNSFLATKISFINQISSLCQSIPGISIDEVAEGIGVDPRIGRLFLNAGPGYGGSCLPKDLETIIQFSSKIGVNPILLKAVQQVNDLQIKQIIHLLEKNLGTIKNKRITILGLSFKENSDDVRESRSIELIKILLKKKSKITVHDPKAMKNTEAIFKNKITR